MAQLAPVPLLTFENSVLDGYCVQVCADGDIALCYVTNATGKIQSNHRNEKSPTLKSLVGDPGARSVAQIAAALRQNVAVSECKFPVQQNGKAIGQVVLLLSRHAVLRQRAEIAQDFNRLTGQITGLSDSLRADFAEQTRESSRDSLGLGLIAGVTAILLGAVAAYRVAGSIARPIHETAMILKDIAEGDGDLTRRLTIASRDEIGELARWFNTFVDKLQAIIGKVSLNTVHLSESSENLSITAWKLAQARHRPAISRGPWRRRLSR